MQCSLKNIGHQNRFHSANCRVKCANKTCRKNPKNIRKKAKNQIDCSEVPIIKIEFAFDMFVIASKAKAGAYRTTPIYRIICNEYVRDAMSRVDAPKRFSKY